jgi:hypothetical protein
MRLLIFVKRRRALGEDKRTLKGARTTIRLKKVHQAKRHFTPLMRRTPARFHCAECVVRLHKYRHNCTQRLKSSREAPAASRQDRYFARTLETLRAVLVVFVEAHNKFGDTKSRWRTTHNKGEISYGIVDFL